VKEDAIVILQVDPESSALVRGAAATILYLHIGGGAVGLLSGAAALALRKGSSLHRVAGNVFFVSMLTMAVIGACVSPFLNKRLDTAMAIFTCYLVATAWVTVRRKEGGVGRFEIGAFLVALGIVAADLTFGWQAANSPTGLVGGYTSTAYYVLAAIVALAAASDLKVILRGGISGNQRIARHLGRMCLALFIATASLFLGQAQLFPNSWREAHVLYVPVVLVIVLMIFWLIRVLFTKAFKSDRADIMRAQRRVGRVVEGA
jgi:hypothetical protein